jgi:hypothetical protein
MKTKYILFLTVLLAVTIGRAQTTTSTTTTTTTTTTEYTHIWDNPSEWWRGHWEYEKDTQLYHPMELSLDLFGTYVNPEGKFNDLFDSDIDHGSWGGGAGLNFFFTKMFGIGTDFSVSENQGGFRTIGDRDNGAPTFFYGRQGDSWGVDYWVGNLIVRFPIGNTGLAPYIYGGGGRGMYPTWDWVYGGGVGLEMRFTPGIGIFSDARFLWGHDSTYLDTLTIRAGLRIAF